MIDGVALKREKRHKQQRWLGVLCATDIDRRVVVVLLIHLIAGQASAMTTMRMPKIRMAFVTE
jgi:hypothetical protein